MCNSYIRVYTYVWSNVYIYMSPYLILVNSCLTVCMMLARLCSNIKPVYNGHCISRSPLYNSQVTESQMGLQCAFQPALTGHLSITARLLSPKWVYSVHFNLR